MPNTSSARGEGSAATFSTQGVTALDMRALAFVDASALLELSSDAIIVRDRDNAIALWNRGAELTYGWKADEAVGENSHALLQPPDSNHSDEIDAMLRSRDRWQGEIVHKRRDGTRIVVESRQVVQRGSGGEVLAILEINRDITERKQMMEALEAADKAKDSFLATLGHELRNPLTPLRNGMEVLRMVHADSPEAQEVRRTMERNIRRMTRLIDDLLDVSRITHGHIELRKENVDMVELVREVVSELRSMADASSNSIAVRLPAKPLIVHGDPVRLTQIIENVVHNAIKYTEQGTVEVGLKAQDGDAVLRVCDSGVGIATEHLGRIWEPFVQGETSLEHRRSGLGLGLTLVRTLVDLHGGTIAGMSEGAGKGSEFVIKLPLSEHETELSAASRPCAPLEGRRILIVDDNLDAAQSFAALLKLMSNDVRTAGSGPEALDLAKDYRPDLVLLDIGLPGMNGYEVARALRGGLGDHATIVAVSGYGAAQDRTRSSEAGFDAHFVKPLELEALEQFLASKKER